MGNLHAIPVAEIGRWYASSKGAKDAQPEWFNPYGATLYKQQARDTISPEAAQTFLDLCNESKVPSWAIAQADLKLIRAAIHDEL